MSKDIKTKNTIKDIKAIDKVAVAGERIRNVTAKTKDRIEESTDTQYSSPHEYATSQVSSHAEHFVNKAAIEAKIQTQKVSRYARNKIKIRKEQKEGSLNNPSSVEPTTKSNISKSRTGAASTEKAKSDALQPASSKIKTKEPIQKDIKTTDRRSRKSVKRTDKKSVKTLTRSGSTIKESSKVTVKSSQELAKKSAMKSAKTTKESYHTIKTIGRKSYSAVKKTTNATRHAIQATKTAITFLCSIGWIAILVILLIALIGGIFMTGSSNSGEGNQLSPEVIAHTSTLQKYADKYEIPHFLSALQAIMMQESGGKGNDPMQASECAFNTKFPNKPNGITDPDYSIQVGVQNFAECLKRAKCKDPFDIENLSLAWQGYNYGNGYIEWAVKNFGGYSQGNAQVFSEEQAAKHGWSSYGDPEYVPHVMRYYQFAQLGTGNSQLVNVALTQLGNKGGIPYWSWWGYSSRVEWCAIFVSWCSEQCGMLQDGSMPKFENVTVGMNWFKERNQWLPRGTVPNEGMIIFFDWNNDNHCDHVGMVEKAENGIVYTVEGNSNDEVRRNTYSVNSNVIIGYGTIKK